MTTSELTALIVKTADVPERELAAALEPHLRMTDTGELLLKPAFDELSTESRVACVMLAITALAIVGLRPEGSATPAEVERLSGLPGGTVRPKLRSLLKRRCVHRDSDGRYSVPISLIHRTVDLVRHGD